MTTLKKSIDKNGNRIVIVKQQGHRVFRIQTNGNLPILHEQLAYCTTWEKPVRHLSYNVMSEFYNYILKHGTKHQKGAVLTSAMRKADRIIVADDGIWGIFGQDHDLIHAF